MGITHIFQDCPKLKSYLEGIQTLIFIILNIELPLNPLFYIFRAIPGGAKKKRKLHLLHILQLVARKMITVTWLKPLPPTTHQRCERVMKVYVMEKITAKLNVKMAILVIRWAPIIAHLGEPLCYGL